VPPAKRGALDVGTDDRLGSPCSALLVRAPIRIPARVLPDRNPAPGLGIDVLPSDERRGGLVDPALRVDLPIEALAVLAAGVVAVAGEPAATALFDACPLRA
jgi:hypothetical protein